jgi:uncharacterized protein YndB with AHSA1/START domain
MTEPARSNESVVIERTFDAPLSLMWQLWTDPEHFKNWYGPTGASIPVAKMEVRVGGSRLVCMEMQTPNGPMQMWFTGEYLEVVENHRLVFTESMADEHGKIVSPASMGMPAAHPVTTEVRVELESLGNQTRMVLTHVGIPSDSPGAAGWVMAFDKLAAYANSQSAS